MSSKLINEKHVRKFILDVATETRNGWTCNRVSQQTLDDLDAKIRVMLRRSIHAHPSIGKTFKWI